MNTCPKCQQELRPFEYHEIELLTCSACTGFWFKDGQFSAAKQTGFSGLTADSAAEADAEPSSEAPPDEQDLKCPGCEQALVAFMYAYSSDIPLHRCTRCRGIWGYSADLRRIDALLSSYKESQDDIRMQALPLMLKVKNQVKEEERAKKEAKKEAKKSRSLFSRMVGQKHDRSKDRNLHDILEDFEKEQPDDGTP